MDNTPDFAFHTLGHVLPALALGVAVMILLALGAERLLASAVMRRMLWQAVLLGLAGLLVVELSGAADALSALLALSSQTALVETHGKTKEVVVSGSAELEPSVSDISTAADGQDPIQIEVLSSRQDVPGVSFSQERMFFQDELALLPVEEQAALEWTAPSPRESTATELAWEKPAEASTAVLARVPRLDTPRAEAALPAAVYGLVLLWAAGVCGFAGRAIIARSRLIRLRRQTTPSDYVELDRLVDALRGRMGMRRSVRIRQVAGLSTPVAFGMFHPTVLLPLNFSTRFALPQQQVILAHELAHLAQGDPVWLLIGELVAALYWWHPLAHTARRRLLAAAEQAADEASMLLPNGPDVLADCLVKLGRHMRGRPRLGWIAADGSGLRSGLARRVERLLKLNETAERFPAKRISMAAKPVAVASLMVLTISCTFWVHPKASFAEGEETMSVLRLSWRQSLAAAAITMLLGPLATDTAADDGPAAPPRPAQLKEGPPVDQLLLAQEGERGEDEARRDREKGDRERGEGDAGGDRPRREGEGDAKQREGEVRRDREVNEGEARGGRKEGDRERGEGEARRDRPRREGEGDAEHRERERGEKAEGDRGEPREHPEGQREEVRRRIEQLERERAEFQEQSSRGARELEEALRKTEEERQLNARHLAELEEVLAKLKKEPKQEAVEGKLAELSKELEKARDVRVELAKRAENLNREMLEHRANVQRRNAELERAFAEIRAQQARIEAESARENPERARFMKRIQEIAAKAAELQRAGKTEEAEKLKQEMRELHARLGAPRDRERPGLRGPREGMERLEALQRELGKLREAGKLNAAEQLERELQELRRRLEAPREGDRPGPPPELQVTIDRLRVAMDNLHAAGLHDQAELIGRQIEQLEHEHVPAPPERRDPDARPREPRPEGTPEPGAEIVGQLRGQIEQLRRENEELRQMMKEIREAQERLVNELRERR